MIAAGREANVDGLRVLLMFELDPVATARLVVDLPDGRPLVAADLTGEEVVRLLAGESLSVPGYASPSAIALEPAPAVSAEFEQLEPEPTEMGQVEQIDEPMPDVEEAAAPVPAAYESKLDEPPPGTEPIARAEQLDPTHRVVAYVAGRWRDALVVSRDPTSPRPESTIPAPAGT